MTVQTLSVSFDPYIRAGWALVPIPPKTKGPISSGWNKRENTVTDPNQIPPGWGVGLAHAYSGTMALDIDNITEATEMLAEHDIDLAALANDPAAVWIVSGNEGHAKLLYAMPLGMALPSRKFGGKNSVAYELRCGTSNGLTAQDVLPPSIHPITCQPYRWGGLGSWERLPLIPDALLTHWMDAIGAERERVISAQGIDASWDEIKSALYAINPDCDRETWITTGMALHYAGTTSGQPDQACALWDEWSSGGGDKYKGMRDIMACWRSFTADATGIKLGSLFKLAKDRGWVRPVPDVTEMFAPLPPEDIAKPQELIDLFSDEMPVPRLDTSLFPSVLTNYVKHIGETRGCDPIMPLWAGMVAVSAAADARIKLAFMREFFVPPVLWVMNIADPSDKKSAGSRPMFEPLKKIENEDRKQFAARHLMWEGIEAAYAAERKAYHEWQRSADQALSNSVAPKVRELPPEPQPLTLMVQDTTSQALIRTSVGNPQGSMYELDEMSNWIKATTDPKSTDNRTTWIRGYNAESHRMDRVGAGTISTEMLALSFFGNVQPDVVFRKFEDLGSDGILQRFIPIIPDTRLTRKPKEIDGPIAGAEEYEAMIRRVRSIPITTYYMSAEAKAIADEFRTWYYDTKRPDEQLLKADPLYMGALGKVEGTFGRLTLLLHMIEDPYNPEVSGALVQRVYRIVRDYVVPMLRYVFHWRGGKDQVKSIEKWTVDYLHGIVSEQRTITLRELKHAGRALFRKLPDQSVNEQLLTLMEALEQKTWVKLIESTPSRNAYLWVINPTIERVDPVRRRAVLEARQRLRFETMCKMGDYAEDAPEVRIKGMR